MENCKEGLFVLVTWVSILIGLIAIGLGVVSQNPDMKDYIFYRFAILVINKEQPMDVIRCDHVNHVSGRVLELGPGPGTNFKCWENNTKITEWVGVEPNKYFQSFLRETFETKYHFPNENNHIKRRKFTN